MASEDTQPWHSSEDSSKYNSLFPLLPTYVVRRTLGIRHVQIGLDQEPAPDLRRNLLAAMISHRMRIGLSYAEKRYVQDAKESRWFGLTDRIDEIFDYGQTRLRLYVSFISKLPKQESSYQDLSMQFFYRNLAGFEAAKRLSELGYLCEVATILRSALEQFAFSARLWREPNHGQLRSIRAMHSLDVLKQYVPAAGALYGLLSKYTHFEYDHHTHFFEVGPKQTFTIQRAPVLRAYATHLLLLTMSCISRYALKASSEQFQTTPQSVCELAEFVSRTDRYSDDVCLMLPLDEVLANLDMLLQNIIREK